MTIRGIIISTPCSYKILISFEILKLLALIPNETARVFRFQKFLILFFITYDGAGNKLGVMVCCPAKRVPSTWHKLHEEDKELGRWWDRRTCWASVEYPTEPPPHGSHLARSATADWYSPGGGTHRRRQGKLTVFVAHKETIGRRSKGRTGRMSFSHVAFWPVKLLLSLNYFVPG